MSLHPTSSEVHNSIEGAQSLSRVDTVIRLCLPFREVKVLVVG